MSGAITLPTTTIGSLTSAGAPVADGLGIFNTVAGYEPSPFDHPEIWNSITINGFTWDQSSGGGYIVVRRAKRAYKWDTKNPAAQVGQNQNFRGLEFPPFELAFHFWDTSGWNYWQQYSKAVFIYDATKLAPGTSPPAVKVYHPSLAALSISALIVDDVGGAEQMNEGGEYRAVVVVREFKTVVAKNVNATPVLSSTIAQVTILGHPLTRAEVEANSQLALTQQAQGNGVALYQPADGSYVWSPSQGGVPP